jgi:hypothetical protein
LPPAVPDDRGRATAGGWAPPRARQTVRDKTTGKKCIRHPVVGELEFDYEALASPGNGGQLLIAYTFPPDSPTHERLRLLSSWSATTAP